MPVINYTVKSESPWTIRGTQSSLFKDDLGTLEDTVGSDTECPSKRGVRCVEIQRKGLKNERDQFLVSIVERVFYGLIVVLAKILLSQASRLRHLSKKGSDIPNQFILSSCPYYGGRPNEGSLLSLGARELSVIERCLYCRGRNCNKFDVFGTKRTVRLQALL